MTDKTTALPEPAAMIDEVIAFFIKHGMLDQRDEYSLDDVMGALRDNYEPSDATALQEAIDRADRAEKERDRLGRKCDQLDIEYGDMRDRTTTTEAALATVVAERDAAHNEALEMAVKIIKARMSLYADVAQRNALRECISSINAAKKETPNADK